MSGFTSEMENYLAVKLQIFNIFTSKCKLVTKLRMKTIRCLACAGKGALQKQRRDVRAKRNIMTLQETTLIISDVYLIFYNRREL